jgi:C4-dicarboxylate transporter DctM subunit
MIEQSIVVAIFFITFFGFLFLGVPLTFSLGSAAVITLLMSGLKVTIVLKSIFAPFISHSLLAIFLFTLMGIIFERTGLAAMLVNAIMPIIGRLRGGLALVAVYSSAMFGALTGSANATCVTFCNLLGPEMMKKGYPGDWTAATIASAAPLGSLIPPSIACIVLGVAAGISISDLFIIDFAIGVMTILALSVAILIIASRRKYGGIAERYSFLEKVKYSLKACPLLVVPATIIGGMYGGIFTPTEAGAVGSLLSLGIALAYRKLNLRIFLRIMIDTASTSAIILFLISTSYILSYVMNFTGINQMFINSLVSVSTGNPVWGMLFLLLILMIAGCFIDTITLCVVLTPTAVAALSPLGINAFHIAALFLISNLAGGITPPVGVYLFSSSYILKQPIEKISRAIIPYIIVYLIITIIVTVFPGSFMWLPRALGLNVG